MPTIRRDENADISRVRTDSKNDANTVLTGYKGDDGGTIADSGDQDARFVTAFGRASADGVTGLIPEPDGAAQRIATDELGHLWVNLATPSTSPLHFSATTSPTGENSRIVAGSHVLVEVIVYNNSGGALYVQMYNGAGIFPNGSVPTLTSVSMSPDETVGIDVGAEGLNFPAGITVLLSTTPLTLTLAGATAGSITIIYR